MRLTELDPRWLHRDGVRQGFVFRCPHCQNIYLSCFIVPQQCVMGRDEDDGQYGLFRTVLPESDTHEIVPCRANFSWQMTGSDFGDMTIAPSIDASPAGHWHGWITAGQIR